MIFEPIHCGMTYALQVIIHTVNLILRLRFCQVRIMNLHNILELRENSVGHNRMRECNERAET